MLTSRALWLALFAALLLHSAVLLGGAWWHLPWQLPSKHRPSIMVQLLRPPSPPKLLALPPAPAPQNEGLAQPNTPAKAEVSAQHKQTQTAAERQPSLAPTPAPAVVASTPAAAAPLADSSDQRQISLIQDMQAPDSVELQYQLLSKNGDKNQASPSDTASLRWLHQEDAHYQLLWQQSVNGKSSQMQSTGVLGADGLEPLRYSEMGSDKSEVATHFVQDKQHIIFSNNSPSAVLPAGVQDRVSVLMQIGGILAAQYEAQALSEALEIPVAGSSQMRMWHWQVLGLQPALPAVQQALGEDANAKWLAVQHDPSRDGGQPWEPTITVWYDCNGFLPVRIESRYPSGQVLDAQLAGSQTISSLLTP